MGDNGTVLNVKTIVKKIDGYLTEREGLFLYNTAKNASGRGAIVEIGSYKGKSTVWIAKGSLAGKKAKVYSVDPHTGDSDAKKRGETSWTFDTFRRNIRTAECQAIVVPIVKTSENAAKGWNKKNKVEFIFIDGDHNYEFVKNDVSSWYSHVVDGGIIALHDTVNFYGPKKVVEELALSGKIKDMGFVDTITFGKKCINILWTDKFRNRLVLLVKNMYELFVRLGVITLVMK